MNEALFILFVADQDASTALYRELLQKEPRLDVPGMTEFQLTESAVVGLMPQSGIKRILGNKIPDPAMAHGVPRAELYLRVDDPAAYLKRLEAHGGRRVDALRRRDWGDAVAYGLDLDGHILAFASPAR